jgi:hypothetical protein
MWFEMDLIGILVAAIAILSAYRGMIDWIIAILFLLSLCSFKLRWGIK